LEVDLGKAQRRLPPGFVPKHYGWRFIAATQKVFGEVQSSVRKPPRSRHAPSVHEHPLALMAGDDLAKIPNGRPEFLPLYGPAPQFVVAFGGHPAGVAHGPGEPRDVGRRDALRTRPPQGLRGSGGGQGMTRLHHVSWIIRE